MPRYGQLHRTTDFIERVIPRRGSGTFDSLFVHNVIAALKRMDAVQEANYWLSLTFYAAGGIWAFYKGQMAFILIPGKNHLRLVIGRKWETPGSKYLLKEIALSRKTVPGNFKDTLDSYANFPQWRLKGDDLSAFCGLIDKLPVDSVATRASHDDHPRNFPSEVRQAAFEEFRKSGFLCPGTPGRKRHKVNVKGGDRIEYDHILPHASGGSRSVWNVQVLCSECNSLKRAKAV